MSAGRTSVTVRDARSKQGHRTRQANERRAKFKRAGKLGQENDHSMQVPILPAEAIFLSSNLPVESQQADDATPFEPRCCVDVRPVAHRRRAACASDERQR
jgi:hypothetical protein